MAVWCWGYLLAWGFASGAERPPLPHAMMGVTNGCFVETVALLDAWQEKFGWEAWARLLQWGARPDDEVPIGHAVAVVEAQGVLWCWDSNFGWRKMTVDPARREDLGVVAAPIVARYPKTTARHPTYRHDFPQRPSAEPPAAQLAHENPAVRDASLVGERLARRRPVNVVRFSYAVGDQKRESAAAVFVFHGRYCVYTPEFGTVPFRARGDVGNLQLIQQALRRMFPAVSSVTKLSE
jgi:hypothetical protein